MNIFILSWIVEECVKWTYDKHVTKMVVETAQLLSTAHWVIQPYQSRAANQKGKIYKSISNKNHGCAIWARKSKENYMWLAAYGIALAKEYEYRYGRRHKTHDILEYLQANIPFAFESKGMTHAYQAMPDEYKDEDPVIAYRKLYVSTEKRHLANWTKRKPPLWWE